MRRRPTAGRSRQPGVVDVELVEMDGDAPDPAALLTTSDGWAQWGSAGERTGTAGVDQVDGPAAPPTPEETQRTLLVARRRRRRWVVTAAGAGTALLVWVALGVVVESRQEAARLETLADSPGILPPLNHPLTPAWTVDGGWVNGEVGDLLLVGSATDSGTRAVDAETGEVRWTYDPDPDRADSSYCTPLVERGDDGLPLYAERQDALPPVACQWSDYDDDLGGWVVDSTTVEIVDPADGAVLHPLEGAANVLALEVRDGGLVAARATTEGYLEVTRWTMGTWEKEWSYRSPDPLLGENLSTFHGFSTSGGVLRAEGRRIAAVSLDTGREVDLAAEPGGGPSISTTLPDGGTAVWSFGTGEPGSGQVLDADGSVRFDLPGPPSVVPVDDGSATDVLVVQDGNQSLSVIDAATGHELWTLGATGYPIAQVDGVLVFSDWYDVHAVDVRTGRTIWESSQVTESAASSRMVSGGGMTDGTVVLVPGQADGQPYLGAYAIADGSEQWRTPLPAGTTSVYVTEGGTVIAGTDDSLTAMR